jgi:hypothetical protein
MTVEHANTDGRSASRIPRIVYQTRCPACGGLRRPSEFAREVEPITSADLVGQVFEGRSKIRTVDRLSYAENGLQIAGIRRRWIRRIKHALAALEAISTEIVRRFHGLGSYRVTVAPTVEATRVAPPVTLHYEGLHV